ncbi:hypothetical protein HRI_000428900 [Hibiscus trionum]|uniref:Uncharacterized protein n=1 Tax=Hibiscus trionum TaxID=183268 RepID=A0A9W7LKP4_HIBTR|nr:hypothetical protein HRI_000428900 [Hibiscus trionum]
MLEKIEILDTEKMVEEFESMTKDAENVQNQTLKKILEENGSSEYLQNLGLNSRTDPESFKACVPLVTVMSSTCLFVRKMELLVMSST